VIITINGLISTLFIGYIYGKYVTMNKQTIHAEISVIPIGTISGTSMSKEIADASDAIRRVKDLKAMLIPMGTQIETTILLIS
jgi:Thiamine-binding protein